MIAEEDFKIAIKVLKSTFTSPNFLPDDDAVRNWYQMLKDIDYKVLQMAIYKYAMTNKFPPTVAEMRELAAEIMLGELPDWGEGWEQVLKAIKDFGYMRPKEAMDSFDDITRECVKRLGFINICKSENISVERANFRQLYEQIANRQREAVKLPIGLQRQIARLGQTNIEERKRLSE